MVIERRSYSGSLEPNSVDIRDYSNDCTEWLNSVGEITLYKPEKKLRLTICLH